MPMVNGSGSTGDENCRRAHRANLPAPETVRRLASMQHYGQQLRDDATIVYLRSSTSGHSRALAL